MYNRLAPVQCHCTPYELQLFRSPCVLPDMKPARKSHAESKYKYTGVTDHTRGVIYEHSEYFVPINKG